MEMDQAAGVQHVIERLKASHILHSHAEFTPMAGTGNANVIECSWLLKRDPNRPNQIARPIRIFISDRAADMICKATGKMLDHVDKKIIEVTATKMNRDKYDEGAGFEKGALVAPFDVHISDMEIR